MTFSLFTSIPPQSDYAATVASWRASGFRVTSVNNPSEAAELRRSQIDTVEIQTIDRRLKIAHILDAIRASGVPFAGIINADCRMMTRLEAAVLPSLIGDAVILAERIDVDGSGRLADRLSYGFDAVFFNTSVIDTLASADKYNIGNPWWDYWFPFACMKAGYAAKRFDCPILLHTAHDANWSDGDWARYAMTFADEFSEALPASANLIELAQVCYSKLQALPVVAVPGMPADVNELIASIPRQIVEINELRRELDYTKAELARILVSRSFRATKPLRWTTARIRRALQLT